MTSTDMSASTVSGPASNTTVNTFPATTAVFAVTELREAILSHTPPLDLFVDQRVCHAWKNSIASSRSLRQKMYLEPTATPLDPLAAGEHFNAGHHATYRSDLVLNPMVVTENVSARRSCPIRFRLTHLKGAVKVVAGTVSYFGPSVLVELSFLHGCGPDHPWLNENASWRKMLLSQTPIKTITLHSSPGRFEHGKKMKLSMATGLTLGALWDKYWEEWEDLIKGEYLTFNEYMRLTFSLVERL